MLNIDIIVKILQDFHEMTGIRCILKDANGNVLASLVKDQGQCEFCRKIYEADGGYCCYRSDQEGYEKSIANGKPAIYTCHAGLTDVTIPLHIHDEYVGAVVTGQYFTNESDPIDFAALEKKFKLKKNELKNAFNDIRKVDSREIEFFIKTLHNILNYVISIELKYLETVDDKENFYMSYKIAKAEQIIKNNFSTQLSMHEVAKEVGVSHCHFSVSFKKHTGISFKEYLTNERINKAKLLLKSTEMSVTDIAFDIGYNDSSYFSTLFKKETGHTPSQYRHEHKLIEKPVQFSSNNK